MSLHGLLSDTPFSRPSISRRGKCLSLMSIACCWNLSLSSSSWLLFWEEIWNTTWMPPTSGSQSTAFTNMTAWVTKLRTSRYWDNINKISDCKGLLNEKDDRRWSNWMRSGWDTNFTTTTQYSDTKDSSLSCLQVEWLNLQVHPLEHEVFLLVWRRTWLDYKRSENVYIKLFACLSSFSLFVDFSCVCWVT
jgi:hypothetical protein